MASDPLTQSESTSANTLSHEQKLQAMLSALWDRSRHTVAERAELLQVAGNLWVENRLDEATRLRAVDSAHKLAGVLGTFGLPRGPTWRGRPKCASANRRPRGKRRLTGCRCCWRSWPG